MEPARGAYTYNNAGQLSEARLSGMLQASYLYNAQGQRTRKSTASGTTVYHYDLKGRLIGETRSDGTMLRAYVWTGEAPLAQIDRNLLGQETVVYLHADHQGTPRLATNSAGTVVWRWVGSAFGDVSPNEDPDNDGGLTTVNLRYEGMYSDSETGLYYWYSRYYDPKIGRGISADRMSIAEHVQKWRSSLRALGRRGNLKGPLSNVSALAGTSIVNHPPLELNPYAYVANNPLRWVDPTGESAAGAVCGALGLPPYVCEGAAAGAGSAAAAAAAGATAAFYSPEACPQEHEERCAKEWEDAYATCADQMKRGGARGVTGGYTNEYDCARGLVSQRCGGNRID